jgi:hypothetical protein
MAAEAELLAGRVKDAKQVVQDAKWKEDAGGECKSS